MTPESDNRRARVAGDRLARHYRGVFETAMRDVPICNLRLDVEAIGFRSFGEAAIGQLCLCCRVRAILPHDSVEDNEDLPRQSDKDDLRWLAEFPQGAREVAERRFRPRGRERGHVEGAPDAPPSAADRAFSAPGSAVVIEGGEAGESGDRLGRAPAELGHEGEQGHGGDGSDAWHAAQAPLALVQGRVGVDHGADARLHSGDFLIEPGDMPLDVGDGSRIGALAAAHLFLLTHVDELVAALVAEGKLFAGAIDGLALFGRELAAKLGEHAGVDGVGFGAPADGSGEVAGAFRIDAGVRDAGFLEAAPQGGVVVAGGLEDDEAVPFQEGARQLGDAWADIGDTAMAFDGVKNIEMCF